MAKIMLLVEDSITTQKAVITAFEHDNFDIATATQSTQALRELQTLIPDIILADATMADMDGFRLCQVIRKTERVKHVPVILLTSSFTVYDEDKGSEVGVTAHLPKPFESEALRDLVYQLVTATSAESPGTAPVLSQPLPSWPSDDADPTATMSWQAVSDVLSDLTRLENHDEQAGPTPETAPDALPDSTLPQSLGSGLLHMIRESVHAHLGQWLQQVTPELLKTVQHEVNLRMPALLEALLQKEIDKLKQAVEQDAPQGDQQGGP